MKILAIDSSAKPASVSLLEDEKIVSEYFINTTMTHSQTLMPMVDSLLKNANTSIKEIDLFAVAYGPGSFTGIRIGICAIKGMSYACKKPCVGISTLEALAYNLINDNCIAVPVMDARRNQVYNAIFDITDSKITRLQEDRAISIEDLYKELDEKYKNSNKKIIFVGDGAEICYNKRNESTVYIASQAIRFQRASSVGLVATKLDKTDYIKSSELMPFYLRLPQAQRELNLKKV